jgi:LPS-assembly lipoprotein
MSWSEGGRRGAPQGARRRGASAIAGGLLALLLLPAGCGFHPLYGTVTNGPVAVNVQQQLEAIRIVPSANRLGQQLYNSLRDRLNPRGVPSKARYVLVVELVESQQQLLLEQDQAATRTYLMVTANYHLSVAEGHTELLAGTVRTRTGYNLLSNEYATRVAMQDAEARSAVELADGIRQRLAIYLAEAPAPAPGKPAP